jgi:hypothetical protein
MSNAGDRTDWRIVAAGLAFIVVGALLIMFLDLNGRRVVGIIMLIFLGLGLCVAGGSSSGGSSSGGARKAG